MSLSETHPAIPPAYANGKQLAQQIFMATLARMDIGRAMREKLRFSAGELIAGGAAMSVAKPPRVIALGKAAARMAAALSEILPESPERGLVIAPDTPGHQLNRYHYIEGGHPYPSRGSLKGGEAALELLEGLTADDLVIFLISGGGSALFEKPLDTGVTLQDFVELNRVLVTGGLPIEKINAIRKHISAVKGGRLSAAAFPARQFTVYISDVPEGAPSMIASGPTMPDESTSEQCYQIAEQSGLLGQFPRRIRERIEKRSFEETPKPGDKIFSRSSYFCLLSNHDAVEAARAEAEKAGFHAEIERGEWDAEYQQVVDRALGALDRCQQSAAGKPACLVGGGEVICRVTGHGVGGRNLSLALYSALKIDGRNRVALSGATDGRDGNSPSCGGVADGHTIARARARGLDPAAFLAGSDAYHFFCTLGDTLETGFTGNNVRDVRLLMSFE